MGVPFFNRTAVRRCLVVCGVCVPLLAACDGLISQPGNQRGKPPVIQTSLEPFQCDTESRPSPVPLRRLSKHQYEQTLRDLLSRFLDDSDVAAVMSQASSPLAGIPNDVVDVGDNDVIGATFGRMVQRVGDVHLRSYIDVADDIAGAVVADEARRRGVFGDCVEEDRAEHQVCVRQFIERFGALALRRPLDSVTVDFFLHEVFADDRRDYEATAEALHDLLMAILLSPKFLYHVEMDGDEMRDGYYALSPYELASRLSYHFWNTMPDEELAAAAQSAALMTDEGYAAQVERLYNDPRAAATFREFFYEWLGLERTGDPYNGLHVGDAQKDTFVGETEITPDTKQHMIDEALAMTEFYRLNGSFEDLLTSRHSFAQTNDLASIYGVDVWDGRSDPPTFADAERQGVLGRAALLSSSSVYTHPILRGVRVRRNLLCDDIPEPPGDLIPSVPPLTPGGTNRDRIETLTSPAECNSCHQYINGLGFPLDAFDSLGRLRQEEMIIDEDGAFSTLPIDTTSRPAIFGPADPGEVSGPADLSDALLESGKPFACFARHYVRFVFGRSEVADGDADGCMLEAVRLKLENGEPLKDIFRDVVFEPAFRERKRGDL